MRRYTVHYEGLKNQRFPVGSCMGLSARAMREEVESLIARDASKITIVAWDEAETEQSAAALHHIRKGCCDGTDPVGCYQRQQEAAIEAETNARAARAQLRRDKDKPWSEFDGTE